MFGNLNWLKKNTAEDDIELKVSAIMKAVKSEGDRDFTHHQQAVILETVKQRLIVQKEELLNDIESSLNILR